jgi:hypothetical protein
VLLDVITIADEADRQLTETVRSFMAAATASRVFKIEQLC